MRVVTGDTDILKEHVYKAANRFCELTEERQRLAKRQRQAIEREEFAPGKDLTHLLFKQQVEARELREKANAAHKEWRKLVRGFAGGGE